MRTSVTNSGILIETCLAFTNIGGGVDCGSSYTGVTGLSGCLVAAFTKRSEARETLSFVGQGLTD